MNEHIPIVMARKPIKTSVAKNVQKYGTGALNIDECRVGNDKMTSWQCKSKSQYTIGGTKKEEVSEKCVTTQVQGRFPSNVLGEIPEHQKYFFNPETVTTINSENNMKYQVIQGNNIDSLKNFPDNHFDSIVTDPPYGISFLGKDWDAHTGEVNLYKECLRVLKPGGHILAFSAARTYHKLATSIEEAGFEIRDQIMWIYSSGFPKSQDVGKSIDRSKTKPKGRLGPLYTPAQGNPKITACEVCGAGNGVLKANKCNNDICPFKEIAKPADNEWAGWGTALKPAHEPIVMARKPIKTSVAKNVQKYGTGALNIDECRIEFTHGEDPNAIFAGGGTDWTKAISQEDTDERATLQDRKAFSSDKGRFPSNVLGEIPDYQKYFYCPKVSRKERHVGHEMPPASGYTQMYGPEQAVTRQTSNLSSGNNHPTVKPVELMKYLIKLVTPPNGKVLDPFNGSGSTGMAAVSLGHEYVGLELDPNYVDISIKRIEAYNKPDEPEVKNTFNDIFDCKE